MDQPARTRTPIAPVLLSLVTLLLLGSSLTTSLAAAEETSPGTVVVTTEVLGAVVQEMVGDRGEVLVLMPGGANPHTYEPSARDAERIYGADLLVSNGLDLEEGLLPVLEAAERDGATWFEAADHVDLRQGDTDADHEGGAGDEHADEQGHGAEDPHFWTDPLAMRDVVIALATALVEAGIDTGDDAEAMAAALERLDAEVAGILASVPPDRRKLVTGHRSMGYFADRYGFELIGTVIPGLSTAGEPSARELAALIEAIRANDVPAVFSEVGTPQSVARAVSGDSGAELVELLTSQLPEEGGYAGFILDLAHAVADALGD